MDFPRPRAFSPALLAAALLLSAIHLVGPSLVARVVVAVSALLAAVVVGRTLTERTFVHRRPWELVWVGLALVAITATGSAIWAWLGHTVTGTVFAVAPVLGFAVIVALGARTLFRSDARAVASALDAGVFAVSITTVVWALALGPLLDARDIPAEAQHAALVAVLALGLAAGVVLTAARTIDGPNTALTYLLVAVILVAVCLIGRVLIVTLGRPGVAPWEGALWILACGAATAAALHPTATTMDAHPPRPSSRVTPALLVGMGAALAAGPAIGVVQAMDDRPVNTIVIGLGTLTIIPLVMLRFADLARTRVAVERRLSRLAHYDELTGLANRRELDARVEEALARLRAGSSAGVVAVFCDLDGFKDVNDLHGHRTGDEVLVVAARRLRTALRQGDLVARFGGDEFVIVAEGEPDRTARETARRITEAFIEPICLGGIVAPLGASIGTAVARPGQAVTATELLSAADAAMYRDKEARRLGQARQAPE